MIEINLTFHMDLFTEPSGYIKGVEFLKLISDRFVIQKYCFFLGGGLSVLVKPYVIVVLNPLLLCGIAVYT